MRQTIVKKSEKKKVGEILLLEFGRLPHILINPVDPPFKKDPST